MSTALYREHFATLPPEGPAWLAPLRARAMEQLQGYGFPTPKNEDWHFTNPAPITEAAFQPMPPAAGTLTAADVTGFQVGSTAWPVVTFVNGRFAPSLSRLDGLPAGVRLMSLAAALHEEPTLLERHLAKLAAFDSQAFAFTALNTAMLRDGAVLHVAQDVVAETPIHLLFVSDRAAEGGVSHPRNLVVLDRFARATIIEQYVSTSDARYLTNSVTECVLDEGATLNHYKLQREGRKAFHVGHTEVVQGRDSHYVSFAFSTGASLSRNNIYTTLGGEGCGATLNGLYMLDGDQLCDTQTRIEHAEPNCYSREIYKGILDGSSHGVFNGKVYVRPIAQKTDGKQTNKTLLLSDKARIDTKPQLEIFADDVKCTHGAT
ncbi:MAG TPA: SufD family Fe-S cluster assembly protein, partial [Gemmatimonadaceae bacterium]|nr:SufD family Fe-S cluster assembly protein [Gemmatimonadaceae bacterium]